MLSPKMRLFLDLAGLCFCLAFTNQTQAHALQTARFPLAYQPAPIDNPLKGLVPYQGDVRDHFPHSMEFNYIALSALMKDWNQFDWKPLEALLDDIASRGHHAIFRVYLEYPGKQNVIPAFLIRDGVKVHRYLNTNTQPFPPAQVETPDYNDPKLVRALTTFLQALGKKYDGDPRIGFITAGLLGTWGEWHTYPRSELFANKATQSAVLDAYAKAFQTTPVLLRYPAGERDAVYASTLGRPFGYHDDSFAWATLETGKPSDSWFYMALLRQAGAAAQDIWKRRPIGGEIRPEAWGIVFDPTPSNPQVQNFRECIERTHASWLMDSGMFSKKQSAERIERAKEQVGRMGYAFTVSAVTLNPNPTGVLNLEMEIVNRGVAPFYYPWGAEFALLAPDNRIQTAFRRAGKLTQILPDGKPFRWRESLDISQIPKGTYALALRIPNPLSGGRGLPLRFANKAQDAHRKGYLTLHSHIVIP